MNKHVNKVRKATGRAEAITAGRQQNEQQYLIIQLMKKKESIKTGKASSYVLGGLQNAAQKWNYAQRFYKSCAHILLIKNMHI